MSRYSKPRVMPKRDVLERFWEKVDVRGPDECWEWTASQCGRGYKTGEGYGQFGLTRERTIRAHRLAAKLKYGMFDERLLVLHACDNRKCVNPAHLSLGTAADNMADMDAKGRRVALPGERHPLARLSDSDVADIRARYVRGHRFRQGNRAELASEFGISEQYVVKIANGTARKAA